MGSDRTDMPDGYACNTGSWISSAAQGGSSYRLGSLNFYNYLPMYYSYTAGSWLYGDTAGPRFFDSSGSITDLSASSNVFYKAAASLTGEKSFSVVLPAGITMHVVVR